MNKIPVLLWKIIRLLDGREFNTVKKIRLPYLVPGIKIFDDPDLDPEEPDYLFYSASDNPILVAAFHEWEEVDSDGAPWSKEYLRYHIGRDRGWMEVQSLLDVYHWNEI